MAEDVAFGSAGGVTLSGADRALRLVPVYSAVSLLADSVASLPLKAARRRADGTRDPVDYRWPVPEGITMYTWLHQAMASLLTRGNAYGVALEVDKYGWPSTVAWADPSKVRLDGGVFHLSGQQLPPGRVLHIPAFTLPGSELGLSPVGQFATTVDAGLYADLAVRDWYANGSTPAHALRNRERVIDAATAQVIKERYKSTTKTGDPFVHGADWELSTVGVSAADAAFLDAIKANATQVAAIYRVPPEKIGGETGSSMTYATTEQQSIDFVTFSLRPWLVRLEQSLSSIMPRGLRAKFNADAMIRPDTKTRMEAYQTALDIGILTQDEARAYEDRLPLTEGEVEQWLTFYRNTTPAVGGQPGTPTEPGGARD